jgi:hypothetical protein
MKSRSLLPDPFLTLIVCEVLAGASSAVQALRLSTGGDFRTYPEPLMVMLVFILFESVRHARPLGAAVTAALAAAAALVPAAVADALYFTPISIKVESVVYPLIAIAACSAVCLLIAGIPWLVRRWFKRPRRQESEPRPRPTGWLRLLLLLFAALPLVEAFGWGYQAGFRAVLGLWETGTNPWHGWGIFYRLDRLGVVVLCAVAAYALLRRWHWARWPVALYLVAGLVITLVRAWFYHGLYLAYPIPEFGALPTSGCEYQFANVSMTPIPSIPFQSLTRLNLLEAGLRAFGCVVIIPYLFISRDAKYALGRSKA